MIGLAWLGWASGLMAEVPEGVLNQLSSETYEVRKKAYSELKKWSVENIKTAPERLYKVWCVSKDPEVKSRCYTLMNEMVIQRRFGRGKGFVGVRMEEFLIPGKNGVRGRIGVRISMVLDKTPAQKSGLRVGDIIMGVDELDLNKKLLKRILDRAQGKRGVGQARVAGMDDAVLLFSNYIQSKQPDDVITLRIFREGKMMDVPVTLMKRPASADFDAFGRSRPNDRSEREEFFNDWLKKMEK